MYKTTQQVRAVAGETGAVRVNLGCGPTPTPGWLNFDNSLTVPLARCALLIPALYRAGICNEHHVAFAQAVRQFGIKRVNVVRKIPLPDRSVEVAYSSHMLEHLDPAEVGRFLSEVARVLVPNGILRIAVPDLLRSARRYLCQTGDADELLTSLNMARPTPRGVAGTVRYVLVGFRGHRWMYDARSLIRLLHSHGYRGAKELPPGMTTIPDPGPLDLYERSESSVYVEAKRL